MSHIRIKRFYEECERMIDMGYLDFRDMKGMYFKLKAYVGINQRFVFCERFPNDEEHAGLHETLYDFIEDDAYIEHPNGMPLAMGFYNITLSLQPSVGLDDNGIIDTYFIVDSIEPFSSSELEDLNEQLLL